MGVVALVLIIACANLANFLLARSAIRQREVATRLAKAVLLPLGMKHSSFVWQTSFEQTAVQGYSAAGVASPIAHFTSPLASSTLYTTLGDYSSFVAALLKPSRGSTFAMEEQSQILAKPNLQLAWGLGVAIEQTPTPSYFHWGSSPGFQSFFMCQPATGRGVLFLTNSDDGLDLLNSLLQAGIPQKHPILNFSMLHPQD